MANKMSQSTTRHRSHWSRSSVCSSNSSSFNATILSKVLSSSRLIARLDLNWPAEFFYLVGRVDGDNRELKWAGKTRFQRRESRLSDRFCYWRQRKLTCRWASNSPAVPPTFSAVFLARLEVKNYCCSDHIKKGWWEFRKLKTRLMLKKSWQM